MLRVIAKCPHCGRSVAIDDDSLDVVFDPDQLGGGPCPHIAFMTAGLAVTKLTPAASSGGEREAEYLPGRSASWLWAIGEGVTLDPAGKRKWLSDFVTDFCCD